jgi:DNA-binding NarL/FixJ family response regulator
MLADDHRVVVEGFRKILEPEFDLLGMAEDGQALLETAPRLKPDIILLDISMPRVNGIKAARELRKLLPETKLIVLTMHANAEYVAEAFRSGASGYVLKHSSAAEVIRAIHEVWQGRSYVTPLVTKDMVETLLDGAERGRRSSDKLTSRQREVLRLVAEGRSLKEIAATLHISVKTVEFHKSRLMAQVGLRTTAELTQYAIRHGLVSF